MWYYRILMKVIWVDGANNIKSRTILKNSIWSFIKNISLRGLILRHCGLVEQIVKRTAKEKGERSNLRCNRQSKNEIPYVYICVNRYQKAKDLAQEWLPQNYKL